MTAPIGTTGEIAERIGAELRGSPEVELLRLDTVDRAGRGALTFLRDDRHLTGWSSSGASSAIVSRALYDEYAAESFGDGRPILVAEDADLALVTLLESLDIPRSEPAGVHELACVHETASIASSAAVGAHAHIGEESVIGEGAVIGANAVIGRSVRIGDGCTIRENAVIYDRTVIGDGSTIHGGAVIGADGFGYRPGSDGRTLVKVPHIGHVEIGRDVEIGANTTIDRGKFGATVVGDGTKIDNLVMIGHNCRIGRCCVICGNVGLSGSVTVGDGVTIAGGAGIADNLKIGDGSTIGAQSGVIGDVPPGSTYLGAPARDARRFMRNAAAFDRLDELFRKIKPLLKDVT